MKCAGTIFTIHIKSKENINKKNKDKKTKLLMETCISDQRAG